MEQFFTFVVHHWALWLSLVVILFMIIRDEMSSNINPSAISPQHAVTLMNHQNAVVYDLRDKDTYDKGHVINALNKSLEVIEKQKKHMKKAIVLICDTGEQSAQAVKKLKREGFEQVHALKGGMRAWLSAELPLEKKE